MCSKSRIKDELLEYTKRFVIVEVKPDSHRVVSRRFVLLLLLVLLVMVLVLVWEKMKNDVNAQKGWCCYCCDYSHSYFFPSLFSLFPPHFSLSEPLGKWEKDNCPANTRLMYVPVLSHFNFKVERERKGEREEGKGETNFNNFFFFFFFFFIRRIIMHLK